MIEINGWMNQFLAKLDVYFPDRVRFVGLQGSYGRGEATETSDIDVVVILDQLSAADIQRYNTMLDTLPHRELICGFLSGESHIMNWESSDLFQFCHDTIPIRGSLDEVFLRIDQDAVIRAIKIGACNIFHGCVHNMLHEKSEEILKGLYKSASFVVQAICFQQTGTYFRHHKDLLQMVSPEDQIIITTYMGLKHGKSIDFSILSETLFNWASKWIENS